METPTTPVATPAPTPNPVAEQAAKDSMAGQNALANMLGLGDIGIVETRIVEPEGTMKVVKSEATPVDAPAADGTTPAVETPVTTPAAEKDIYDTALEAMSTSDTKVAELTEEVKGYLKAKGIEDLDAILQERASNAELTTQYQTKAEAHDRLLKSLSTLPAEIGEAIDAHNKGEDYTKALMPLTKGVTVSKEAKKIDKFALVGHYFPGKFSEEDVQAIKDGDDRLEKAFDLYREQAAEKHDLRRKSFADADNARAEANKSANERNAKAIADAIAFVRQDKVRATFLDKKTIDDFTSGKLVDELLYNKDGTPKLESLAHLIDGIHLPKMVERMRLGAMVKGRNEGRAKVMSTMSPGPDEKALQRNGNPAPKENADALHKQAQAGQAAVAAALG